MFFLYDVSAFVLFNFSASALKHVASPVGIVRRSGESMFCVRTIQVAARFALRVATGIKIVTFVSRAFVKSRGNAGAGRVGAFCVAVMVQIDLLDFFNPRMLGCNLDGNIAGLPVRRRCGDVHRSAVHCVHGSYPIVAGRFVKNVARLNFRTYGHILCRIGVWTGRASEPYSRVGVQRADFARFFYADFRIYGLCITDICHTF